MYTEFNQPVAVSVKEAVGLTSLGRTMIYKLIQEGRLTTVKAGRRTLIPMSSIRALIGEEAR